MFAISDRSKPGCLVVEAEGAVTGSEYEVFAEAFEKAVKDDEVVNLVVVLKGSVRYGDLSAVRDDWRFAFKDYHHARRAAFVGDEHIIDAMMRVFSWMTRVEDKMFDAGQLDDAIVWAGGS